MKLPLIRSTMLLVILLFSSLTWSASNDNLNTILDLETKITQKIRFIIQPIDPDAIVIAKVEIVKINTELAGTQMSAVGILSTAGVQSVEENDIQAINVQIMSVLDPFPNDLKTLIEGSLRSFSKKSRVRIIKMSDSLQNALKEGNKDQSELNEKSKTGWQKTSDLADQISKLVKEAPSVTDVFKQSLFYVLLQIIFAYSLIQGVILFFQRRFQGNSIKMLRDALSSLSLNTTSKDSEDSALPSAARTPAAEAKSGSGSLNGSITTKDNPLEQMYVPLLRDLLADCYWCHQDSYAAWIWSQLSPPKRMELLEAWNVLNYYVKYFTHLEPKAENYHLDPIYLRPRESFLFSNGDLLETVRTYPYLWNEVSILRQRSFTISLKERLHLAKLANTTPGDPNFQWNQPPSQLRVLKAQIEMTELTIEDETLILKDPEMVPDSYRDSLHSLVWAALLPKDDLVQLLQKIPAQVLAEIWIGPEDVLSLLKEALPAKKQELLSSYLQKVAPSRGNPTMKYLSELALNRFRELYPPVAEAIDNVLPLNNAPIVSTSMPMNNEVESDIDALVAAFRKGEMNESLDAPQGSSSETETPSDSDQDGNSNLRKNKKESA